MLIGNPKFDRFVAELRALRARIGTDETAMIEGARALLGELVATDDWLPSEFAEPHPTQFKQYRLYRSAEDFTVLCVVWGPGQKAPPHDHTIWGLVGQLRGAERTRLFDEPEPGRPMRVRSTVTLLPGQTTALSPTLGDIHDVENVADGVSVSIHVYGADLESLAARRRRFEPTTGTVIPFEASYH